MSSQKGVHERIKKERQPPGGHSFSAPETVQLQWRAFPAQQGFGGMIRWRAPVPYELGIGKDVERLAAHSGKERSCLGGFQRGDIARQTPLRGGLWRPPIKSFPALHLPLAHLEFEVRRVLAHGPAHLLRRPLWELCADLHFHGHLLVNKSTPSQRPALRH